MNTNSSFINSSDDLYLKQNVCFNLQFWNLNLLAKQVGLKSDYFQ